MPKKNRLKKIASLIGFSGLAGVATIPVVACTGNEDSADEVWAILQNENLIQDADLSTAINKLLLEIDSEQELPSSIVSNLTADTEKITASKIIEGVVSEELTLVMETITTNLTDVLNEITIEPVANDEAGELTITFQYGEDSRSIVLTGFLTTNDQNENNFWDTFLDTSKVIDDDITTLDLLKNLKKEDQLPSAAQKELNKEQMVEAIKNLDVWNGNSEIVEPFSSDNIAITADDKTGELNLKFSDGGENERTFLLSGFLTTNDQNQDNFWVTFLDTSKVTDDNITALDLLKNLKKDELASVAQENLSNNKEQLAKAIKNLDVWNGDSEIVEPFSSDNIAISADDKTGELNLKFSDGGENERTFLLSGFLTTNDQNQDNFWVTFLDTSKVTDDDITALDPLKNLKKDELASVSQENLNNNKEQLVEAIKNLDVWNGDSEIVESFSADNIAIIADDKTGELNLKFSDGGENERTFLLSGFLKEISTFVNSLFDNYSNLSAILLFVSPDTIIKNFQKAIFANPEEKTASEKLGEITINGELSEDTAKAISKSISDIDLGIIGSVEGVTIPEVEADAIQTFSKENISFEANDKEGWIKMYVDLTNQDISGLLDGIDDSINIPITGIKGIIEDAKVAAEELKQVFYFEQTGFKKS